MSSSCSVSSSEERVRDTERERLSLAANRLLESDFLPSDFEESALSRAGVALLLPVSSCGGRLRKLRLLALHCFAKSLRLLKVFRPGVLTGGDVSPSALLDRTGVFERASPSSRLLILFFPKARRDSNLSKVRFRSEPIRLTVSISSKVPPRITFTFKRRHDPCDPRPLPVLAAFFSRDGRSELPAVSKQVFVAFSSLDSLAEPGNDPNDSSHPNFPYDSAFVRPGRSFFKIECRPFFLNSVSIVKRKTGRY